MSIFGGARTLWVHQWDQLGEQSVADVCATATQYAGASIVLKKLFDGQSIMGPGIDHSPLAPVDVAAFQAQQTEATANGVQLLPWVNATHHTDAALHATAGPVLVVDIEPYQKFWGDGAPGDVETYIAGLRAGGVTTIIMSIDPRPSATQALAVPSWVRLVDGIAPQLYWTDFQQPESAINPLIDAMAAYGVELLPVFPYDAQPGDLLTAWLYARSQGAAGVSLWRMGTANAAQLRAFCALALPSPKPKRLPFDTAARLAGCGYLAGGSSSKDMIAWLSTYDDVPA